jgi:signal transduction histidine kinase
MTDLLRDGYIDEITTKQGEHLAKIDRRLRSLHQMIGELLTIARTRDRSREIPDVVVDLRDLAEYAERTYREQAAGKGVEFRVVAEDDLPEVDSGADLLEQVIDNLVSNAIKYTPEGGEIEVRLARRGPEEVRIVVRDTGIGIPAADQENLFREFFRASNAKKLHAVGTGLGLTLVKQTVERHDGRLHLASQEGKGTTVVIDLPARQ